MSILEDWLKPADVDENSNMAAVPWFASRVASLISVENNSFWYERVSTRLSESHSRM